MAKLPLTNSTPIPFESTCSDLHSSTAGPPAAVLPGSCKSGVAAHSYRCGAPPFAGLFRPPPAHWSGAPSLVAPAAGGQRGREGANSGQARACVGASCRAPPGARAWVHGAYCEARVRHLLHQALQTTNLGDFQWQ